MASANTTASADHFVRGLFRERRLAERAFKAALDLGYTVADINAIMADETRERLLAASSGSQLARKVGSSDAEPSGEEVGGPTGATIATIAPALAAIGTVLLVPGIVALGPIAVALTAAGAMGVGAGLIGALTRWGVPSAQVTEYEAGIREGGILLAIKPRTDDDSRRLVETWKSIGGESVHS